MGGYGKGFKPEERMTRKDRERKGVWERERCDGESEETEMKPMGRSETC